MAVVLWAAVLLRTNPWTVRSLDAPVVAKGVGEGLQVMSVEPSTITVKLAGRRHRVSQVPSALLQATVGLANRDVGEHDVKVLVSQAGRLPAGVEVIEQSVYTVRVIVERTVEQRRAVLTQFRGRLAPGFVARAGRPRPNEVTVRGPRNLVAAVGGVVAVVDYSGLEADRTFTVALEAHDARGMPQAGVVLDPTKVEVDVDVEAVRVKTVSVRPDLRVPDGRALDVAYTSPATVTITGEPATLRGIASISTVPVSVDDDATLPAVELALPRGISVVGAEPVVRLSVRLAPVEPESPPGTTVPVGPGALEPAGAGENGEPGGEGAPKEATGEVPQ
jgi:YbbR domain-containing protein